MGSGYPSDPTTKAWLKGNIDPLFGYGENVRFSWKTVTDALLNKIPKVTW